MIVKCSIYCHVEELEKYQIYGETFKTPTVWLLLLKRYFGAVLPALWKIRQTHLFNRPGVAGAVLQTPLIDWLIDYLIN